METTAQIDLSGISPLCDFPFYYYIIIRCKLM